MAGLAPRLFGRVEGASITRLLLLAAVILTPLSVLVQGHDIGNSNQSFGLAFVLQRLDPSLFPHDPWIEAVTRFPTYFWAFVAAMARVVPLGPMLLALHVIIRFCLLLSVGQLAHELSGRRWTALLAMLVLAFSPLLGTRTFLAGSTVAPFQATHTAAAMPLSFWALLLILRGRYAFAFLLWGVLCNIHSMTFLFVGIMLLGAVIADRRARQWQTAAGAAAGIVAALPTILWTLRCMGGTHDPDFPRLLFITQGYHHFTRYWGLGTWLTLAVFVALAAVLWRERPRLREGLSAPLIGALAAIGVSWVISFLCTEVWPVPTIMKFHLYRADVYPILIVVLLACDWAARHGFAPPDQEGAPGDASGAVARVAALLAAGLVLGEWALLAWSAWAIALLRKPSAVRRLLAWAPLLVGGLALPWVVGARDEIGLVEQWARQSVAMRTNTYLVLAVVAAAMATCELFLRRRRSEPPASATGLRASLQSIVIVVLGLLWIPHGVRALRHVAAGSLTNLSAQEQAYRDLQLWCAGNTPKSAIFLVPPRPEGFRSFSRRPIYCDWKDKALWSPGFETIWWERMTGQIGTGFLNKRGIPDLAEMNRLYGELSPERVTELAHKANASYIVREAGYPLSFDRVYSNDAYLLYRLPSRAAPDS